LGWNISYTHLHVTYEILSVSQWWWGTFKRYHTNLTNIIKGKKVKESLNRPGVAQRVREGLGSQIS
jgi:hypothetical protein